MLSSAGIYEIVNTVNGRRYIGSATRFSRRFSEHRSQLRRGTHNNSHLQSSWRKYGESAFRFCALIVCDKQNLLMYEQRAMDGLRPEYNKAPVAGSSLGRRLSAEARAKIAAKARGRKRSPESIAKSAAAARGRKLSPEHRATLLGNKHALGMKHTDEWKAANSARNKGINRPKSPEHRAKIAASLTGRKATPEHRANQSAAQTGKKRGPYRKRNQFEAET